MAGTDSAPITVVFSPDFLGAALQDARGAQVLYYWRDGLIRPALNRALLLRYLKLLRQLGLSDVQQRRWGWWFSATDRTVWVNDEVELAQPVPVLCAQLAQKSKARYIFYSVATTKDRFDSGESANGLWVTAHDFLHNHPPVRTES
jgi:hypothetical protein